MTTTAVGSRRSLIKVGKFQKIMTLLSEFKAREDIMSSLDISINLEVSLSQARRYYTTLLENEAILDKGEKNQGGKNYRCCVLNPDQEAVDKFLASLDDEKNQHLLAIASKAKRVVEPPPAPRPMPTWRNDLLMSAIVRPSPACE